MRLITKKSECKKNIASGSNGQQRNTVVVIKQFTTLNYAITCKPLSENNQLVIFKTQMQDHTKN